MRRMLCAAVLAAAVSSLGFAQGASVTIQNEESIHVLLLCGPARACSGDSGEPACGYQSR